MSPNPLYQQIPYERYLILRERYDRFLAVINDASEDVIKIFDRLGPQHQKELTLIREVTKELQEKKEEDMRKAAQAAEEASKAEAEKAKEEAESKEETKDESEETPVEPETIEKVEN